MLSPPAPAPLAWKGRSLSPPLRFADQSAGAVSGHARDDNHLAAIRLDNLLADHVLAAVVAAFYHHHRPHPADPAKRGVLVEEDHEVHGLERGRPVGPGFFALNRPAVAFETRRRGIAVEPYDEAVAGGARFGQHPDMTGMQQIEAAVGETDAQVLPPPFRQPLLE